jgi:hypothetical protein
MSDPELQAAERIAKQAALSLRLPRAMAAAGVLLVSTGSALVYPPAGLIVGGLFLFIIGIGALR